MLTDAVRTLGASVFYPGPSEKARFSRAWTSNGVKQTRLEPVAGEVEELIIENAYLRESVLAERDQVVEAVEEVRKELAKQVVCEIRTLLFELRPLVLET
jgi:hypothetical protein